MSDDEELLRVVSDREPSEMAHRELRYEWEEVVEALRRAACVDVRQTLSNRRQDLWSEMKSRVDAEPPECPECGVQSWSQAIGEPKVCADCGLHLGWDHEDLIQRVDDYWNAVQSPGIDRGDGVEADGGREPDVVLESAREDDVELVLAFRHAGALSTLATAESGRIELYRDDDVDRGDGVETDGGRPLPDDYDRGDGYDGTNGLEECPHCGKHHIGQAGHNGAVYDQSGRRFDNLLDTDPENGPFFCSDCWEELDANRKASENESLETFVTDGGRDYALPTDAVWSGYRDSEIGVGDVVVDLSRGVSLQVMSVATKRAGEHPAVRSDRTAEMFGTDEDDLVFNCVFLPDGDDAVSPPRKTYAYPESRLLRFPTEEATGNARLQREWLTNVLEELAVAADAVHDGSAFFDVVDEAYGSDVAELVEEFAAAAGGESA